LGTAPSTPAPSCQPMSRPKILHVLGSLLANDVGEEVVAVAGALVRAGVDTRVVSLGERGELTERLEEAQVRTYALSLTSSLGVLRAVGKVRMLIRATGVDAVHGYGSWGGTVVQLAAPRDVGVVRSLLGPPVRGDDLRGRMLRLLERRALGRHATRFVVPSDRELRVAVRSYAAAEGHVTILPTSVDVASIQERVSQTTVESARRLMGIREGDTVFVLASKFHSEGVMDGILTGMSMARVENPGIRIFMVGAGPHEGAARWKAEELKLEDSVVFLGEGMEASAIWAAADAAIDSTLGAMWARPALVAMAAGLPAVKMDVEATEDESQRNEPHSTMSGRPELFAAELVRLAGDPMLREVIRGQQADMVAEADVARAVEELEVLYASVIADAQA